MELPQAVEAEDVVLNGSDDSDVSSVAYWKSERYHTDGGHEKKVAQSLTA